MKLNKVEILRLVEEGYLMVNTHPDYPLQILNYTRKAQFERYWTEYTLLSRGLIIDYDFNVVAYPFKKFFNYEELKPEDFPNATIAEYDIYDKMDGSLGILFYYDGLWHVATRGSFTSDQAIRAKSILKQHDLTRMNVDNTYLFEIIYPENRIVVNYDGAEKLVLLGIIDTTNGYDFTYDEMVKKIAFECSTFEVVKRYDPVASFQELKSRNILNQEGYVMRYGDFRMKCKFEDYCRLHSIITNVSTKDIWACLRDGNSIAELIENTPDEFDEWVKEQVKLLEENYYAIEWNAKEIYNNVSKLVSTKKDFAEYAMKFSCSAILFKMYDGKPYNHIIWSIIEPKFSKPFFKQEDGE
jgi:hypothetical protein